MRNIMNQTCIEYTCIRKKRKVLPKDTKTNSKFTIFNQLVNPLGLFPVQLLNFVQSKCNISKEPRT